MVPVSIQLRLARRLLGVSVVLAIAVTVAVWFTVRNEADELLDDTLRASSTVLAGLLATQLDGTRAEAGRKDTTSSVDAGDGEFAWQLADRDGRVRLRSAHAPRTAFIATPTLGFTDIDQWRVLGVAFAPDAQVLYVAQTRGGRDEAVAEISGAAALVALVVAALGLLWLRQQVRRELEPLQALSDSVAAYDPLRPDAPLGPPMRAEFAPVHAAIDSLGQRLAQRVAVEKAVTAHAAHALRTPLAGIDAQLAVALRECPAELRPRLTEVRGAAGRLQGVVAALLTLFRSGGELHRMPVNLSELLARLPVQGLIVNVEAGGEVDADADLLAAALANLLDNALRHGAHRVDIRASGRTEVHLADDGPGVPPARRAALQAALDRQAYDYPLGLGLTLADRVARAHGGRLVLAGSEIGFRVVLTLAPTVAD